MRSLLTLAIMLATGVANAVTPMTPADLFKTNTQTELEYVSQQTNQCAEVHGFQTSAQEQASEDLVMSVMLAARESGIPIHVVEDDPCTQR